MHHCPDCYRETVAIATIALRCDKCVDTLVRDMRVPTPRKPRT